MKTVSIPASLDEATTRLGELDALLTATGWERAAIVAAYVEPSETRRPNRHTSIRMSTVEFAALGIAGLTTADTVRRYALAWLTEQDGKHPKPGASVRLPNRPWPPEAANKGSRTTKSNIGAQIKADPVLAEAAASALAEGAIELVAKDTNRSLSRAVDEKIVKDYGPKPKPRSKPRPSDDDEPDWIIVRKALDVVLDVVVRIEHGLTPPPDVAMRIDVLRRPDIDAEARKLIGDHS